ncbi:MAG TPA: hypothetical protein VNJ54_08395 [Plantibacter sp.]|uniref:hypothetical protein n=1 Tax=Plantibacter sp. TaxID=1871045 RepID=UPI002B845027|nr:hypothetical protein [Plantibacter sp.]
MSGDNIVAAQLVADLRDLGLDDEADRLETDWARLPKASTRAALLDHAQRLIDGFDEDALGDNDPPEAT